jgi:hypothetical protein
MFDDLRAVWHLELSLVEREKRERERRERERRERTMQKTFQLFLGLSVPVWIAAAFTFVSSSVSAGGNIRSENRFNFPLRQAALRSGKVQYFYKYISIDDDPTTDRDFRRARSLDRPGYYRWRGDENYHVVMTRSAHVVDFPIERYTFERVSAPSYVRRILSDNNVRAVNGRSRPTFRITGGAFQPNCQFEYRWASPDRIQRASSSSLLGRLNLAFSEGVDAAGVVFQHFSRFTNVATFRTSRGALAATTYFDFGNNKTLIVTETLSYLYNTPPDLWGGTELVREQSEAARDTIVRQTRRISP